MRRLEAAQQLVERVQHLLGQTLADLVLVLAAVLQQRREPLAARQAQQPSLVEQQPQGGADRPAGGPDHVRHPKIEPAGAFAARGRDQAQRETVEEQARRDAGVAQQALHARVRRRFQAVAGACGAVEIPVRLADLDEKLPGGRVGRRRCLRRRLGPQRRRADCEIGAQSPAGVRQGRFELGGNRRLLRTGIAFRREAPAEHGGREGPEVRQPGLRLLPRREAALPGALPQQRLPLDVPPVEHRARPVERRRGNDEAGGRHESDPLQVGGDVGVRLRHFKQPGLRRPAGVRPPEAPSRSG